MLITAKRKSDIESAKWEDFDLAKRRWFSHDTKTKHKNDRLLPKELISYLTQRKGEGLSPFPPMTKFNRRIKSLATRLGLDREVRLSNNTGTQKVTIIGKVSDLISSKTCRHSSITYLRVLGVPTREIQDFANHQSLKIHNTYGEHQPLDTGKYFEGLSPN